MKIRWMMVIPRWLVLPLGVVNGWVLQNHVHMKRSTVHKQGGNRSFYRSGPGSDEAVR